MYYGLGCNCDAEVALAGLGVGQGLNMDPKQAASGAESGAGWAEQAKPSGSFWSQLLNPKLIESVGSQTQSAIKTFGETQAAIRLARAGLITGAVPDAAKREVFMQEQQAQPRMSNTTILLIGAGVLVGGILLVGALSRK